MTHYSNEISPFDQYKGSTFTLYLEPILNTYYKTYQNIITVSNMPQGPLKNLVCLIKTEKLSIFQVQSVLDNNPYNCTYALTRYPTNNNERNFSSKQSNYYMNQDDIPSIFSYLRANGYSIDIELSKMMNKSKLNCDTGGTSSRFSGNKQMICIVNFQENV
jgi:hypothetical protein